MCVCVCVCVCSPTLCIIIIFKCIYLAKRSLGHHWPDLLSSLPHDGSSFAPANSSCHRRDRVPWLGLKGVPTVCQLPCTGSRSLSQWTIGEVPVLFPVWSLTYLTWGQTTNKTYLPTGFPLSAYRISALLLPAHSPSPHRPCPSAPQRPGSSVGPSLAQGVRVQVSGMGSTCSRLENSGGRHFTLFRRQEQRPGFQQGNCSGFWAFSCEPSASVWGAQFSPEFREVSTSPGSLKQCRFSEPLQTDPSRSSGGKRFLESSWWFYKPEFGTM